MTQSGEGRMTADEGTQPRAAGRRGAQARDPRFDAEREAQEREVTEDREISEAERLEFFRSSMEQSYLPDLPSIPGYHVCWLSTTHQRDTIAWRQRLGYQLIRVEDLPHWDGSTSTTKGNLQGVVSVNEMVAAKLPLRLYNMYMKEWHERMPLDEEAKLKSRADAMKAQAERAGSTIDEGEGQRDVVQRAQPMPEFVR